MGQWNTMAGEVKIEIVSADIPGFLTNAANLGIVLNDVIFIDLLTVQGTIQRSQYKKCAEIAENRGARVSILSRKGMYWKLKRLRYRPFLVIGIFVLSIVAVCIPSRIFFVKVEGNMTVPERMIIEQAEYCGIHFGASRREVRSEKVKNALLSKIPELQWIGVNTSGCVATISVREKSTTSVNEQIKENSAVSSIVASRDGVIQECTVLRGNALCQVGQAVRAGETLVSGYTDCGISIRATRAEAEVFAQTLRNLEVVSLGKSTTRKDVKGKKVQYALMLGKKLIKFYKDSGISDTTCVKMYTRKVLTLPGGFQLPVALITEEVISYNTSEDRTLEKDSFTWMVNCAQAYLNSQMISGQILREDTDLTLMQDNVSLNGEYVCLEMIGQVKNEEIRMPNG